MPYQKTAPAFVSVESPYLTFPDGSTIRTTDSGQLEFIDPSGTRHQMIGDGGSAGFGNGGYGY